MLTCLRTLLPLLLIFTFCQGPEDSNTTANRIQPDASVANVSLYLAGLAGSQKQNQNLYAEPYYKQYSQSLHSLWSNIETQNREPILSWKQDHISIESKNQTKVAYYPFSGADFINLYTFYPHATRYIMMALEPRGIIEDPATMSPARRKAALASLESLVSEISVRNYFTRVRMRRTLHNTDINGTLPVFIIFISRLGLTVLNYEHVKLNADGQLIQDTALKHNKHNGSGLRIRFTDTQQKNNTIKELIYLDQYVNPTSFSETTPEGKFLNRQGKLSTFLKSAEYILHQNQYADYNGALVNASNIIIQDDSGIPLKYIQGSKKHKIKVFGTYTDRFYLAGTPGVKGQSDLKQLYKQPSGPLPFAFGYGILHGKAKSNLLIASVDQQP